MSKGTKERERSQTKCYQKVDYEPQVNTELMLFFGYVLTLSSL
jgi:hypothetical protein